MDNEKTGVGVIFVGNEEKFVGQQIYISWNKVEGVRYLKVTLAFSTLTTSSQSVDVDLPTCFHGAYL